MEEILKMMIIQEIKKGDIVLHWLSKILFRCENAKMERWMNMNPYYKLTNFKTFDYEKLDEFIASIQDR